MNKFTKSLYKTNYGNRLVINMYQNNKLIGESTSGFKNAEITANLHNIYIIPVHQCKQRGSQLLNYTEYTLFNYNIRKIEATIHQTPFDNVVDFYLKNGYLYNSQYSSYNNGSDMIDLIGMYKKFL